MKFFIFVMTAATIWFLIAVYYVLVCIDWIVGKL